MGYRMLLVLGFFLLLIPTIESTEITTFNDSTSIKNFTVTQYRNASDYAMPNNRTAYVKIPKYAHITKAQLNMSGYNDTYTNLCPNNDCLIQQGGVKWDNDEGENIYFNTSIEFDLDNIQIWTKFTVSDPDYNMSASICRTPEFANRSCITNHTLIGTVNTSTWTNWTWNVLELDNVYPINASEIYYLMLNTSGGTASANIWTNDSTAGFWTPDCGGRGNHQNPWNPYGTFSCRGMAIRFYGEQSYYVNDTFLDVGNDGDKDWNQTGSFDSSYTPNQTSDFKAELHDYLQTCSADVQENCTVPFVFHLDSPGTIEASNMNITYDFDFIINCSDGGAETLLFDSYDEINLSTINFSLDVAFDVSSNITNKNYSFSFSENDTHRLCVFPAWSNYTVNATMDYWDSGYEHRNYYYYQAGISNTTQTTSLYLISDTDSDRVTFTVKDAEGNLEEDVYVKVQRYYVGTNTYRTVAIGKSDYLGQFITYMDMYDVWYKFILEKDGVVVQTISPMKIASTDITLMVEATGVLEWLKYDDKISYSCSYNNATENLVCTASDTSGYATKFCLNATNVGNNTALCSACDTSSSVTLTCHVGNATGETIHYQLSAALSFNPIDLTIIFNAFLQYGQVVSSIFGLHGLFMSIIVMGSTAFTALWKPSYAIIALITSLAILSVFGIVTIPWATLLGIIFMGAIVIYRLRA